MFLKADLTDEEFDDLIASAWLVSQAFQKQSIEQTGQEHRGFLFAVQDGKIANQSIPHVHVHLIPRD